MAPPDRDALRPAAELTPLSVIGRTVVATLSGDLTEAMLQLLRDDLLARVHRVRAQAVVFDVSSLPLIDPWEFEQLRQTAAMVHLLGARAILAGLQPAAVEVLAAVDVVFDGFDATVLTVDAALQLGKQ